MGIAMIKAAVAGMVLIGATSSSFAQEYCDQVRQGIAQYGYKAARQYAVEHYTSEQVKAADACVVKLKLRHEASVE
jgi:alanine racemase